MAAPVITTPAPSRTASGLTALAVAATITILGAIAIVAVVAWSPWSARDSSAVVVQYGAGYPLHGGLAGPSRIGPTSTVDVASHHGAGYPLHGGLAGPSQVDGER